MQVNWSKARGETLTEVMLSVVIFSLMIIMILLAFSQSTIQLADLRQRVIGLTYARSGIEDIRNMRDTSYLRYKASPTKLREEWNKEIKAKYSFEKTKSEYWNKDSKIWQEKDITPPSLWERQIKVSFQKPNCPQNITCKESQGEITSTVFWAEGTKSLSLKAYIYDFLNRQDYER